MEGFLRKIHLESNSQGKDYTGKEQGLCILKALSLSIIIVTVLLSKHVVSGMHWLLVFHIFTTSLYWV